MSRVSRLSGVVDDARVCTSSEARSSSESLDSLEILKSLKDNNPSFWEVLTRLAKPAKSLEKFRPSHSIFPLSRGRLLRLTKRTTRRSGVPNEDWQRWDSEPVPARVLEARAGRNGPPRLLASNHQASSTPIVDSSSAGPPVLKAQPASLVDRIGDDESVLKSLSDMLQDRSAVIEARSRITVQQKNIALQLPFDRAAYGELLALLNQVKSEILASDIPATARSTLTDKWATFDSLTQRLDEWQSQVEQEKDNLHELEARLLSKEKVLYEHLGKLRPGSAVEHANTVSGSQAPTTDFQTSNVAANSAGSEDSDEENYYQAIGQINLLRDRLFNLESSLSRDQLRHENREKSAQPDLIKGSIYEQQIQRRKEIIESYQTNKDIMELSRRHCDEKKLKVESPNLPPDLDHIFTTSHDNFQGLKQASRTSDDDEHNRVEDWLQDVQWSASNENIDTAELLLPAVVPPLDLASVDQDKNPLVQDDQPSFPQAETVVHGEKWSEREIRNVQPV